MYGVWRRAQWKQGSAENCHASASEIFPQSGFFQLSDPLIEGDLAARPDATLEATIFSMDLSKTPWCCSGAQTISELFTRYKPSWLSTLVNRCWQRSVSSASLNLPQTLTRSLLTPFDKSASVLQTHIWKLCSPAMAQPTARHEGDQGGEEWMAVSQTPCQAAASTQPRSMPAHLAHTGADHQKRSRWWGESRSLMEEWAEECPHKPPLSPPTPQVYTDSPKTLSFQTVWYPVLLILYLSQHCCSTVQRGELAVYPTPKSASAVRRAAKSSAVPLCCGRGSAAGGFRRTHHHTSCISAQEEVEFWVSFIDRCPLLPNGEHRLFTLHLFARQGSVFFKSWTHTSCFPSWLCLPPFFPQLSLLDYSAFPLRFRPHLHCIALHTFTVWGRRQGQLECWRDCAIREWAPPAESRRTTQVRMWCRGKSPTVQSCQSTRMIVTLCPPCASSPLPLFRVHSGDGA